MYIPVQAILWLYEIFAVQSCSVIFCVIALGSYSWAVAAGVSHHKVPFLEPDFQN